MQSPESSGFSEVDDMLAGVHDSLRHFPQISAEDYRLNTNGELNYVLLADGRIPTATKIPRDQANGREKAEFEAEILIKLNESPHGSTPPLSIPTFIEGDMNTPPYFMTATQLSGVPLSYAEMYALSLREQQALGRAVGSFVAWMSLAISIEDYEDAAVHSTRMVYDRSSTASLLQMRDDHKAVRDAGYESLAAALCDTVDEFEAYAAEAPWPTIVGHDDIRPTNIMFERPDDLWLPTGIIDFGIAKPMDPAREFRHIHAISSDASYEAIKSYQQQTGRSVSPHAVDVWARLQVVSVVTSSLARDNRQVVADGFPALRRLLPEGYGDWSQLERYIAQG